MPIKNQNKRSKPERALLDSKKLQGLYRKTKKLAIKFLGPDDEGGSKVDIEIIDRTRYSPMHYRPVPYYSRAEDQDDLLKIVDAATFNLSCAIQDFERNLRSLRDFRRYLTQDEVLEQALQKALGKTPVTVERTMGFLSYGDRRTQDWRPVKRENFINTPYAFGYYEPAPNTATEMKQKRLVMFAKLSCSLFSKQEGKRPVRMVFMRSEGFDSYRPYGLFNRTKAEVAEYDTNFQLRKEQIKQRQAEEQAAKLIRSGS